jgi:hypothetical protein
LGLLGLLQSTFATSSTLFAYLRRIFTKYACLEWVFRFRFGFCCGFDIGIGIELGFGLGFWICGLVLIWFG